MHRNLGVHLSFVRSADLDEWSPVQLKQMQLGGNARCRQFFKQHGSTLDDMKAREKYSSHAAKMYKQLLNQEATAAVQAGAAGVGGVGASHPPTADASPEFGPVTPPPTSFSALERMEQGVTLGSAALQPPVEVQVPQATPSRILPTVTTANAPPKKAGLIGGGSKLAGKKNTTKPGSKGKRLGAVKATQPVDFSALEAEANQLSHLSLASPTPVSPVAAGKSSTSSASMPRPDRYAQARADTTGEVIDSSSTLTPHAGLSYDEVMLGSAGGSASHRAAPPSSTLGGGHGLGSGGQWWDGGGNMRSGGRDVSVVEEERLGWLQDRQSGKSATPSSQVPVPGPSAEDSGSFDRFKKNKAISSAQFFDGTGAPSTAATSGGNETEKLRNFSNSASISSAQLFGEAQGTEKEWEDPAWGGHDGDYVEKLENATRKVGSIVSDLWNKLGTEEDEEW